VQSVGGYERKESGRSKHLMNLSQLDSFAAGAAFLFESSYLPATMQKQPFNLFVKRRNLSIPEVLKSICMVQIGLAESE